MTLLHQSGSSDLRELADLYGVVPAYTGADGTVHEADDDTVRAILRALGAPTDRERDAAEHVHALRAARAVRVLEPVLVHRIGRVAPIRVVLPSQVHPRNAWLHLELEDGRTHRGRLLDEVARPTGSTVADGKRVDGYQLRLGASASPEMPPGLHRLRVEAPGLEAEALLVVAPRCPQPRRSWGAFLPLHALRTDDDWGVGHYPDLGDLSRWVAGQGASFVGTLPLYPTFVSGPADPSPYRPVTRLGWSELYVDPMSLPELDAAPAARALVESEALREELAAARRSVLVDHAAVSSVLRRVLEPMADALFEGGSARRDELEKFVRSHPELEAYARFRAAQERLGHRWDTWDLPGAVPPEGAAAADPAVRYHLYAQFAAHEQLAAAAQAVPRSQGLDGTGTSGHGRADTGPAGGLYLDLPLGVHPRGFDPWWEPSAYVSSLSVGAPPDAFFATGQNWSFPPPHPIESREQAYRHFAGVLRHVMAMAGVVRVDHVMGLHRLYCIPDGDALHGAYLRYPDEELRALVAVEAHRTGTVVVGEDLGTVPPEVRTAMAGDGMQRSWVMQFESTAADPLPEPVEQCIASWGTHDLARFAAFWEGEDIDDRLAREEIAPAAAEAARTERAAWRAALLAALVSGSSTDQRARRSALEGVLAHLGASPARLVLVDLEDLWFERRPQNRPGTGAEAVNWRRRAARTMEQVRDDPDVGALLAAVGRHRSGAPT